MRKIYLLSVHISLLVLISFNTYAQIYTTTSSGGTRLISDAATWVGGVIPPAICNNCTITINGPVTANVGIDCGGCTLTVSSGAQLDIEYFMAFVNSNIIVANNALVNVYDEVHLYGTSTIQLANTGSLINANNDIGNGSHGVLSTPGNVDAAGIYYVYAANPFVLTATTQYDIIINGFYGYGGQFVNSGPFPNPLNFNTTIAPEYDFNCDPSGMSITIPPCGTGLIYGPAKTALTAFPGPSTISSYQFVSSLPLPVTLAKFAASLNPNKTVNVAWTTSLEINSDYFSVERSGDGVNWISLTKVKAKGHSSGNVDYSYTDASPLSGYNYYRLQMVDLDTKYKYSKVAQVSLGNETVPLVVYNNPFRDQIRIKINVPSAANLDITLTDMLGRTFTHQALNAQAGDNFVNITPIGATEGLYILNVNGKNYHQTVKLVKQ